MRRIGCFGLPARILADKVSAVLLELSISKIVVRGLGILSGRDTYTMVPDPSCGVIL